MPLNASSLTTPAAPTGAGASFLPTDYVNRKRAQRAGSLTFVLFCVVMTGVVGAFLVTSRRWKDVREQQTAINDLYQQEAIKIEQLKTLETQRKQMLEKAEIVSALVERVPRSVLLAELSLRMPKGVTAMNFELKGKRIEAPAAPAVEPGKVQKVGSVAPTGAPGGKAPAAPAKVAPPRFEYRMVLTGVAMDNNQIADYLAGLKDCELLANVELSYIDEFSVEKVDFRKFEIVATLRTDVDVKQIRSLQQQTAAASDAAGAATLEGSVGADGALESGAR